MSTRVSLLGVGALLALAAGSSPSQPTAAPQVLAVGRGFGAATGYGWEMVNKIDRVSGQPQALIDLDWHLDALRKKVHRAGRAGDADAEKFCVGRVFIKDLS